MSYYSLKIASSFDEFTSKHKKIFKSQKFRESETVAQQTQRTLISTLSMPHIMLQKFMSASILRSRTRWKMLFASRAIPPYRLPVSESGTKPPHESFFARIERKARRKGKTGKNKFFSWLDTDFYFSLFAHKTGKFKICFSPSRWIEFKLCSGGWKLRLSAVAQPKKKKTTIKHPENT